MIGFVRGKLIELEEASALVETGGIGYEVLCSQQVLADLHGAVGTDIALWIHTHVREDALALFGFLRAGEKQLFEKLLSVSGIGPKLAITILSGMPVDAMIAAIKGNNVASLTRVPGIGKKTAERMVLELRDKLDAFGVAPEAVGATSPVEEDVISALVNLGYQRPMAERALAKIGDVSGQSFDSLFRKAMAALAK